MENKSLVNDIARTGLFIKYSAIAEPEVLFSLGKL